jgi:hypothetical protein
MQKNMDQLVQAAARGIMEGIRTPRRDDTKSSLMHPDRHDCRGACAGEDDPARAGQRHCCEGLVPPA